MKTILDKNNVWNHIESYFTLNFAERKTEVKCIFQKLKKENSLSLLTCESLSPSLSASFFLSGLEMYFCFWKVFSSPFLCKSEKTALRSIPLLGLPLMLLNKENALGIGNMEPEIRQNKP